MGGQAIMPAVVTYLSSRKDQPVALPELAAGIQMDPTRVQKAISNAISGGAYGAALECVHRGQVWVWRGSVVASTATAAAPPAPAPPPPTKATPPRTPAPEPSVRTLAKGDVVEVMGTTRDGAAVAADELGNLYRVVPL